MAVAAGIGRTLVPTRIVGELLRVAYLLFSIFGCGSRQDDIRMMVVIGFRACLYPPPVCSGFLLRNHSPAVECPIPGGGVLVGDRGRLGRRRIIEPINRDIDCALSLQKDASRDLSAPGALCLITGKRAPSEIFRRPDLVGRRHAAAPSGSSSSARASRTNPSGNLRVSV